MKTAIFVIKITIFVTVSLGVIKAEQKSVGDYFVDCSSSTVMFILQFLVLIHTIVMSGVKPKVSITSLVHAYNYFYGR